MRKQGSDRRYIRPKKETWFVARRVNHPKFPGITAVDFRVETEGSKQDAKELVALYSAGLEGLVSEFELS